MKNMLAVLLCMLTASLLCAQTVTSFEGIDASSVSKPQLDIDPNGAVGTKQYMEWVNVYYQAYDKATFASVWSSPQVGTQPWHTAGMSNCYAVGGDGIIAFDRLASRWVIAVRSSNSGQYYYCVAVSNTDDLSSSTLKWRTYQFYLNPVVGTNSSGNPYFPDWPKLGVWSDAYYVSFDLLDINNKYQPIGVLACALDRSNMLTGASARPMQCFSDPSPLPSHGSLYLAHSLIPADIEGTTAPPSGQDEYFVSIQNPPNNNASTTSDAINLWDFHVDWSTRSNSTFSSSTLIVPTYTPGCYNAKRPLNTSCVPEPSKNPSTGSNYHIDSVGDRLMPRMSYRNFGSYGSFLVSHTIQTGKSGTRQTGIRSYELRGFGTPSLYQSNTLNFTGPYRFMPSIAQDQVGNAAVGYSASGFGLHPSIKSAWWNLPGNTAPKELALWTGSGDELNSTQWGDYTSMTVDPVDGCTFWYVNEYLTANQNSTLVWRTRIAKYKVSTCQ